MRLNQTELVVVRGSVLEQPVDAIVNAANTGMRGGGGVDGAIHRAAGPGLLAELRRVAPRGSETSEVVVTGGHGLPVRHIFHVAGPEWEGGGRGEPGLLAASYRGCLAAADRLGLESLAFCSISTGIFGYPLHPAADLALASVREELLERPRTSLRRVVFAMFQDAEYAAYQAALRKLAPGIRERHWRRRLQALAHFAEVHGHLHVPWTGRTRALAAWAARQRIRHREGHLDHEHEQALLRLGFTFQAEPDDSWEAHLAQLETFLLGRGPEGLGELGRDEPDLAAWLEGVRHLKELLPPERRRRLAALGVL